MTEIPKLTDGQWAELLERLTYRAVQKFRKYNWRRGDPKKFEWAGPDGTSPEDLALEAITSVIQGVRKYHAEKYQDFYGFLCSVVDSKVFHMAAKASRQPTQRMPVMTDAGSQELIEVELPGNDPDPADVCVNREVVELARAVVEADAEKDPLVLEIFECLEAGFTMPSEMAEALDVKVIEINKAKKRLRRKLNRAFAGEQET